VKTNLSIRSARGNCGTGSRRRSGLSAVRVSVAGRVMEWGSRGCLDGNGPRMVLQ